MTAKEYLGQAYRLDQRINSKLEQVMSLRDLATKATSTLSDVAPSGTRNVHRMEDIIVKIVDLENEIHKTHIFTHIEWHMIAYDVRITSEFDGFHGKSGMLLVPNGELHQNYAIPSAFGAYIKYL